jgi:plastocyanin
MQRNILIAVVVVALVALGGWYLYSTSYKPSSSNTMGQTVHNQTPQATNSVTIQNMAFSPANISVKKGTTVTWTNQDSVGHTVTETDGKTGPSSSTLNQGSTYSFTYNEVGTFNYHCSIHTYMTGTVTVTQ